MEYLFNDWAWIDKKVRGQKNVVLLCDYDGTLTPIVDRPELAVMSKDTFKRLKRLAGKKILLGIISGRTMSDIKERVNINGVIFAGNHGLEIEGPGLRFVHPLAEELSSVLRLTSHVLRKVMKNIGGVIVEDKGMTLSVHYRLVDKEALPEVHRKFEDVVKLPRMMGKIKTTSGKKVHEVRPAISWDKGKAVSLIFEKYVPQYRRKDMVLIYLGDDRTDEDAFKVVNHMSGISVLVGKPEQQTEARYYLNSTDEVLTFLLELDKLL